MKSTNKTFLQIVEKLIKNECSLAEAFDAIETETLNETNMWHDQMQKSLERLFHYHLLFDRYTKNFQNIKIDDVKEVMSIWDKEFNTLVKLTDKDLVLITKFGFLKIVMDDLVTLLKNKNPDLGKIHAAVNTINKYFNDLINHVKVLFKETLKDGQ